MNTTLFNITKELWLNSSLFLTSIAQYNLINWMSNLDYTQFFTYQNGFYLILFINVITGLYNFFSNRLDDQSYRDYCAMFIRQHDILNRYKYNGFGTIDDPYELIYVLFDTHHRMSFYSNNNIVNYTNHSEINVGDKILALENKPLRDNYSDNATLTYTKPISITLLRKLNQ